MQCRRPTYFVLSRRLSCHIDAAEVFGETNPHMHRHHNVYKHHIPKSHFRVREPRKRGLQAEQNHHSIDTLKKRGGDRRSGENSPTAQTQSQSCYRNEALTVECLKPTMHHSTRFRVAEIREACDYTRSFLNIRHC